MFFNNKKERKREREKGKRKKQQLWSEGLGPGEQRSGLSPLASVPPAPSPSSSGGALRGSLEAQEESIHGAHSLLGLKMGKHPIPFMKLQVETDLSFIVDNPT